MNKLMKFGFLAFAIVFSIASCSETTAQSSEKVQEVAKQVEMSMSIEGMTCAMGCARAIEVELKNLKGVASALVDFKASNATVTYNSALTSEETIVGFVNGYRDGAFKAKSTTKDCGSKKKSCCASKKEACTPEQKAKCEKEKKSCSKKSEKSCCASKKEACTPEQKAACEKAGKSCTPEQKAACEKAGKSCTPEQKAACEKAGKSCCSSDKKTMHSRAKS